MRRTHCHLYRLSVNQVLLLVAAACCGQGAAKPVWGQSISVRPQDGIVDERLAIRITGLKPKEPVIIRASMQDAEGRLWQSYAGFYADAHGSVDLAAQAPDNGTYTGIDVMGLIQSMNLPGNDHNRARFTLKGTDPLIIKYSVEIDGKEATATEVTRRFLAANGRKEDIRTDGLIGTLFTPSGEGPFPGVILLGGSEGGLSSEDVAAVLASRGYAALALAYFKMEGLPSSLEEIPLEYFKRAIDWMLKLRQVRSGGVALIGTSKGAEAALLTASHYKEVRAAVGYVPSSVVWSCICGAPNKSSWSFEGKPVPFIPQATNPTYRPPPGFPISPATNYLYRLKSTQSVQQAIIPVEKINGPVLLISAKNDQVWPSSLLASMVMRRLKGRRHPFANQHLDYELAGHLIGKAYLPSGSTLIAGGRFATGGTPEGNARAQQDSWPKVLKFLDTSLRLQQRTATQR